MDDLVKYINEDSVRGELAREFSGIISDTIMEKLLLKKKMILLKQLWLDSKLHKLRAMKR